MRILIIALALSACVTRTITEPATLPAAVQAHNAAADFALEYRIAAKCDPWTGHGSAMPGVDSVLCRGATWIIYCAAPADAKPRCELAADWTPKAAPDATPTKPATAPIAPATPPPVAKAPKK